MAFFLYEMRHLKLHFPGLAAERSDMLVALLSTLGWSGFEEAEDGLYAYAEEGSVDLKDLDEILKDKDLIYCSSVVEDENWNALWESSFAPIVIPGKVVVRASFHEPLMGEETEIVITPRMSFGTGHHATTWMMLSEMAELDMGGRHVLDFGTGTGILAIMAVKRGAASVHAIDNDPVCVSNTLENASENACPGIRAEFADRVPGQGSYDLILANINRNVILAQAEALAAILRPGGRMLLSGLLKEDAWEVASAFETLLGTPEKKLERGDWILLSFIRRLPL